jgi:nucleotide-binding universal stress UspA family protein
VTGRNGVVLIAWDGSEQARRALVHTARVVGPGRRVAVVNVAPVRSVGARLETVPEDARADQRKLLETAAVVLAQAGVQAELVAATGDPAVEIPGVAARLGAETIVVGRSRRHRLHRKLADRLVRAGRADVLVVP